MNVVRSTLSQVPPQLVLVLAVTPLLFFALTHLRERELAGQRARLKARQSGLNQAFVLERIMVHPIKSCASVELQESGYTSTGLDYDRRWAIIDKGSHKVLTARELNQAVLIHTVIDKEKGVLAVYIPSQASPFEIPLDPTAEETASWSHFTDIAIWKDTTDGLAVPLPELHQAISAFLERDVLLIMKGPTRRALGAPSEEHPEEYALAAPIPADARTAFADGFPFLLVTAWSAKDVEAKAALSAQGDAKWAVKPALDGEPGDKWARGEEDYLKRARGNLVVGGAGGKPWMEDEWGVVQVGKEELVMLSMCGRCQLPNVDPATGIQHPSVPYKLLSKFRRSDPVDKYSPCFGINAVPSRPRGVLRVGDKVVVKSLNSWLRQER